MHTPFTRFASSLIASALLLNGSLSPAQVNTFPSATPTTPQVSATTAAVVPPQFADNRIVLTAEQSAGGNILSLPDGTKAVTLDKSCVANFAKPADACIEWKLPTALPAGWWHGIVEPQQLRWTNRGFNMEIISPKKPSVSVGQNFVYDEDNYEGGRPKKDAPLQRFEFWIYSSAPVEGMRVRPDSDLWRFAGTWPILQITMEQARPSKLIAQDVLAVDAPVAADGSVSLPMSLPPGNYSMAAAAKKEGTAVVEGEDNRTIQWPLAFDRWKLPMESRFYLDSPLRKINLKTDSPVSSVLLKHIVARPPAKYAASDFQLITTVDPAKPQSEQLVLIGSNLTGEAPTFPLLPRGQKTAVVTTWDDGKPEDLRLAELLNKYGYHPSFFMNANSPALQFADKLEALNVEVGSHIYSHPKLYEVPPQRAIEECVEMRKLLEKTLNHPVISMGYSYGYFPTYDVDGDFVLRAVKAAGYWSGRTQLLKQQTVESLTDLTHMDADGFLVPKKLDSIWEATRNKDGGIFHFYGHSWQIGKTDEQWKTFEETVAQFANQPNTWYPSQGELSLWIWARKNVQITVANKSSTKVVVKLCRPWLHPYLAAKCPLTLNVPAGVQKVVWQGKEIPVANGRVEIAWAN